MEESGMRTIKRESARFINSSRTKMEVVELKEDGTTERKQVEVPAERARGVDPYFDAILDQFDIEKLSEDFKEVERKAAERRRYEDERKRAEEQRRRINALFEFKAASFNLPFVEEFEHAKLRTRIRKAKSKQEIDNMVILGMVYTVLKNQDLSFEELLTKLFGPESNE